MSALRPPRSCARPLPATLLLPLAAAGCSPAPAQNILGSFFPAWLLCAAIGIAGAVAFSRLVAIAGLRDSLIVPPLVYAATAGAVALAVWLLRYGG